MTGTADREGIPLSDPTVPIDPEQAARALGRTLAAKHTAVPTTDGRVDLAVFASVVLAAAEADDDAIFDSGPYLDRSRHEMARLAVDTVAALPESEELREHLKLAERLVERRDERLLNRSLPVDRDEVSPRLK